MADAFSGFFVRPSFSCWTAVNISSEIMASWVSVWRYRSMRPSFSIWETPVLIVFWRAVCQLLHDSTWTCPLGMGCLVAPDRRRFFQDCRQPNTAQISSENLSFIGIYYQLTFCANCVSVALALCHFGTAVPKTLPQACLDGLTFLKCIHQFISTNKSTAVKPLRYKDFAAFFL